MGSFSGPNAHQGSTPTKDPRVPGITPGGDGMQPVSSRPHREIVIGAMALVVVLAVLATWAMLKPAGDDTAARASAAEVGLTVASDWRVDTIHEGFRIVKTVDTGSGVNSRYYFDIVATTSVSAPANASTWEPAIAGATAYAENDPPIKVYIDAGAHSWIVTAGTPAIYGNDATALEAWNDLASSIRFTAGT